MCKICTIWRRVHTIARLNLGKKGKWGFPEFGKRLKLNFVLVEVSLSSINTRRNIILHVLFPQGSHKNPSGFGIWSQTG